MLLIYERKKCVCGRTYPSFGLESDRVPKYCKECRPSGAVDVVSKRCECGIANPSFGLESEGIARWCRQCPTISLDAVDVKHRRCQCGEAIPSFGFETEGIAIYCKECKPDDAINVTNQKCVCGKASPSFGLESDKIRKWCRDCRPLEAVDVVSKKCACNKAIPTFGLESDGKALWCRDCRPKEAIDVVHKKCECPAAAIPSFGLEEEGIAKWCRNCPSLPSEVNVKHKKCLFGCGVIAAVPAYKGYCLRCFAHLFPEEKISRNYKTKERLAIEFVKAFLTTEFPDLQASFDKTINGGCSKRRPDAFIDMLTHAVFLEIDEEGHDTKAYCSCENKRMMLLMIDVAMRPVVYIRLNPDAFTDADGIRHPSCFERAENGSIVIRDKKVWNTRLEVFKDRIRHYLVNIPEQEVTVEHLYYNGFI